MCWKECTVAPILSAADEEGLDRQCSGLRCKRKHVSIAKPLGVNRLAALNIGKGSQTIAIDSGKLEIFAISRLGHQARQTRLNSDRPSGEELLRLSNELAIFGLTDTTHAGRRTTLDLKQQTRSRSILEITVRTTS